jgi:hypothetical protein
VVLMMLLLAIFMHAPWPSKQVLPIAVAGVLMQAGYLGGIWCAVKLGMPAGVAALIANIQPILDCGGRSLVNGYAVNNGSVWHSASAAWRWSCQIKQTMGLSGASIALAVMALFSMTTGTLYRNVFVLRWMCVPDRDPVRSIVTGPAAVCTDAEAQTIQYTARFSLRWPGPYWCYPVSAFPYCL